MKFIRYFAYIIAGALVASLLGALFGAIVAIVSPELVSEIFHPSANASIVRYASGLGMIIGVFMGAAGMALALLMTTALEAVELLKKSRDGNNQ